MDKKELIKELKMRRMKYPEPVFIEALKYIVAEETIKQIEKKKTRVFIERAAFCTIEGIRAICGTDEEYSAYVKKVTENVNKAKEVK